MRKSILAFAFVVACLPFTAQAALVNFLAELSGEAELPSGSVMTDASGSAGLVLNDDTNQLSWAITFEGLESDFTAAHFHGPATAEQNASPVLSIVPTSRTQGDGVEDRGGLFINETDGRSGILLGSAPISSDEAGDLLDGLWYINIHSVDNGGGEIRGQVVRAVAVVPLPAAAWLFISALGFLGLRFRRRASA